MEVDERFSLFGALSEVTAARGGFSRPGHASSDVLEVERACERARVLTAGAFDRWRVPGGYDPPGYLKGWAAGRASALLASGGSPDHIRRQLAGELLCHRDLRDRPVATRPCGEP